jgi:hypothetical protein
MAVINTQQDIPIYSPEELNDPKDEKMFIAWLEQNYGYNHRLYGNYYKQAVRSLLANFEASAYWKGFNAFLQDVNIEYQQQYHCCLLESTKSPYICSKELSSVIIKAFRKDFLQNENRPNEPKSGWILPENWFESLNDILRTTIVVKYLDGVSFLLERLKLYSASQGCPFTFDYEARENGYYAAHTGTRVQLSIPRQGDLEEIPVSVNVEIQITTQLQTLIKDLLHSYYEQDRKKEADANYLWQWDYANDRFNTNYMGHIVHYVEGMVVSLRDKRMNQK